MITLNHYLVLSFILFILGFAILTLRRNLLIMLMGVELMLNAVNIALVAFSRLHQGVEGQVAAFFVIVLAAAEAGVGLAIVIALFRKRASVQTHMFMDLRDKV